MSAARDPIKLRMTAVMLLCIGLAASVLTRAIYIQLIQDPRLEAMAKKQFHSKVLIRPRRGTIVDRNGEALAVNVEIRSLAANPSKIQNRKMLARLLAKATDQPHQKIYDRLKEKREFVWIKRHLSEGELARLKKWGIIGDDGELASGLWMVNESKRVYPHGELAAHVLGDVNLDSEGLEGIELWADEGLKGKVVSVSAIRDALGRPTFIDAIAAKHVKDGEQVALTIDASLQYAVEQELEAAVAKSSARGGSAIVMNAVTGEILAMANEPSFNPNEKTAPAARRRNRAMTDGYEPGSTLKSILLAAALSSGSKLTDAVWGERGSFVVQGKRISEAESHEKFEWINLKKMLQVSSNVGAAKLALKLGADKYLNALRAFGFGSRTKSGFPGEIAGKIPARKEWQPLSLANIGFGQGVLVTPIQMIRSYAAFANGGWLVQPNLIKSPAKLAPAEPPKRIISQKVADSVVEALKAATDEKGTGVKARLEGYQVAGKTGTAQAVDPLTGRYSRSRYIASFIGFAVGVEPKLVIYTMIDEPKGIYYGSETAAPLFRSVLLATANRFSLPAKAGGQPLLGLQKNHDKGPLSDSIRWSLAKVVPPAAAPKPEVQWHGATPDGHVVWRMPLLQGLTAREAILAVQGHKFQLEVQGVGVVKSQVPEEGKTIPDGGTVRLTLGEP